MTARRIIFKSVSRVEREQQTGISHHGHSPPSLSPGPRDARRYSRKSALRSLCRGGTRWIDCGGQRRYPLRDLPSIRAEAHSGITADHLRAADAFGLRRHPPQPGLLVPLGRAVPRRCRLRLVDRLSCTEDDLICGQDYPYNEAAKEALLGKMWTPVGCFITARGSTPDS